MCLVIHNYNKWKLQYETHGAQPVRAYKTLNHKKQHSHATVHDGSNVYQCQDLSLAWGQTCNYQLVQHFVEDDNVAQVEKSWDH